MSYELKMQGVGNGNMNRDIVSKVKIIQED